MYLNDYYFSTKIKPRSELESYCKTEKLDYIYIIANQELAEKKTTRSFAGNIKFFRKLVKLIGVPSGAMLFF